MPSIRPTILDPAMVNKAVNDPKFFDALPAFKPVLAVMAAGKTAAAQPQRGCGGCKRRRLVQDTFQTFMKIVPQLSREDGEALKRYFGVAGIMFNYRDADGKLRVQIV